MEVKEKYIVYDSENNVIDNQSDIDNLIKEFKKEFFTVRGYKVMMDTDVAKLYKYSVKRLNEQVKRHQIQFTDDDFFRLTDDEEHDLWSQFATANQNKMTRSHHFVFTETGMKILSSFLKTKSNIHMVEIIERIFEEHQQNEYLEIADNYKDNVVLIQNKIIFIRDQQVMLDSDLAELYGYDVKRLNEQVSRNIERFPKDFMFQLTKSEFEQILKSQFATSSSHGGVRKMPYAFTELGVYMLSAVLKSEVAVQQSILIARAFKQMRQFIQNVQFTNQSQLLHLNNIVLQHSEKSHEHDQHLQQIDHSIDLIHFHLHNIQKSLDENKETKEKVNTLMTLFEGKENDKSFTFFKGQVFDADEVFKKIYIQAQKSIYIIDNYVSMKTLSLLKCKKENVEVIIFTHNKGKKDKLRKAEVEDFNKQYPILVIKPNQETHDRYIILDYKEETEKVFHLGASIKDTGKKTSSVNELENTDLFHPMIEELLKQDDIELEM